MSIPLHEAVVRFREWAASYDSVEGRTAEWELDYGSWKQLTESFMTYLDSCSPQAADEPGISDILYAIGRDNEMEELVEELANRSNWFLRALPYALSCDEDDVRWQFACQLGSGNFEFFVAESALLKLVNDDNEYVRRIALQALGRIGSGHTEAFCERAWETGHEYQRIMAIWVLKDIKSAKLERYLAYTKHDGRKHVVSNAAEIAKIMHT